MNGLANRRLPPLGHISGKADMPDAGASRKRQISDQPFSHLMTAGARPRFPKEFPKLEPRVVGWICQACHKCGGFGNIASRFFACAIYGRPFGVVARLVFRIRR